MQSNVLVAGLWLLSLLGAGCSSSTPPGDEPDADGCSTPLVFHPGIDDCVSTTGINADCADGGACEQGQECVTFYAGAGGTFHECNIACGPEPGQLCPEGFVCESPDDGPENVCIAATGR